VLVAQLEWVRHLTWPRRPGLRIPGFALLLALDLVLLAMSLTIGLTAWLAIAVAPILLVATYLVLRDARSTSTHARPPDAEPRPRR
jgi:hypothetical protein